MMRLSTMQKVVATVDEEWKSPLAEQIMERWAHDEDSIYYYRSSANFVFIFEVDGQSHFLRFNDASERTAESIEAELQILQYLRDKSVHTAQPVLSVNNRYVETVETDIGTFHAVVFQGLSGEHAEMEELSEEQYMQWGRTLGQLHASLQDIPEHLRAERHNWKDQLDFAKTMMTDDEPFAQKEWEAVMKWADELAASPQNYGIIHYDFELDNLCWDNGLASVLDFDDCVNHWYLADIAYALRQFSEYAVDLENADIQAFLKGYSEAYPLDMNDLPQLNGFLRMHNLVMFAKLLRTVDIPENPDYPEWLTDLRTDLLGYLEEYREAFEKRASEK
ncbi:phosphotransferase enzyme family protein [Brevibacillus sp. 179-C9.3 HS]|uniref:phosphotransferase enzyme family protein n=1 Tax=unclassified Brevibacillus TaxID=2684853 RepID=UPI0039A173CC